MSDKRCNGCRWAKWDRDGSGSGNCTYPIKLPKLPAAYYWSSDVPLKARGGGINLHELSEECKTRDAYTTARMARLARSKGDGVMGDNMAKCGCGSIEPIKKMRPVSGKGGMTCAACIESELIELRRVPIKTLKQTRRINALEKWLYRIA